MMNKTVIISIGIVCLLVLSSSSFAGWQQLGGNQLTGSTPPMNIVVNSHDEPLLVDYVKVWQEGSGTVYLEDDFSGAAGPLGALWTPPPAAEGTALLNGSGQAVLSNAGFTGTPWGNLLKSASPSATHPGNDTFPAVMLEMHLIFSAGTGTQQAGFGFGNGLGDAFYVSDQGDLYHIGPQGQTVSGGTDTGIDLVRDGSTIHGFRIRATAASNGGPKREYYYNANIPEPATISMLVLGSVAALRRRRRS